MSLRSTSQEGSQHTFLSQCPDVGEKAALGPKHLQQKEGSHVVQFEVTYGPGPGLEEPIFKRAMEEKATRDDFLKNGKFEGSPYIFSCNVFSSSLKGKLVRNRELGSVLSFSVFWKSLWRTAIHSS